MVEKLDLEQIPGLASQKLPPKLPGEAIKVKPVVRI